MNRKFIKRLAFGLIAVTTLVFSLIAVSVFLYVRKDLLARAEQETQRDIDHAAYRISDRVDAARVAIINCEEPTKDSNPVEIITDILKNNPDIYGSAYAVKREEVKKWNGKEQFMVYAYRGDNGDIIVKNLSDSLNYRYYDMEWFTESAEGDKDHWSEPYYDEGAGDELMCTFSHPIHLHDTLVVGVLTADISLGKSMETIVNENDVNQSKKFLLSKKGALIFGDTIMPRWSIAYKSTLKDTGWTLGHIIEKRVVLQPMKSALINIFLVYLLTVILICSAIYITIRQLSKPAIQQQMRISTELDVARRIQQGMLPKMIPAFPDRDDINVIATMRPAKEVGGDFYNFFIENDNLYFVIADVSGKGVPAALVMAIATELFMVSAPGQKDPSKIVANINHMLSRDNQEAMFITMIVGVLDLNTHELQLCNAGHNPPFVITDGKVQKIELKPNLTLGLMEDFPFTSHTVSFPPGSKLVLYTDGVTEAENAVKELFGEQRLTETLQHLAQRPPQQLCAMIEEDVNRYVAGAEQSDDITILIIESKKK